MAEEGNMLSMQLYMNPGSSKMLESSLLIYKIFKILKKFKMKSKLLNKINSERRFHIVNKTYIVKINYISILNRFVSVVFFVKGTFKGSISKNAN